MGNGVLARIKGVALDEPPGGADNDTHRQPLRAWASDLRDREGLPAGIVVPLQAGRELGVVAEEQSLAERIVAADAIGVAAGQVDLFLGVVGEVVELGSAFTNAGDEFPGSVTQAPLLGCDVLVEEDR